MIPSTQDPGKELNPVLVANEFRLALRLNESFELPTFANSVDEVVTADKEEKRAENCEPDVPLPYALVDV